ncbi:MAG: hypothetical protein II786_02255 [Muribaculaceae bacterium]|nr:hypothetical protein [Muribaculaceae bacterium]
MNEELHREKLPLDSEACIECANPCCGGGCEVRSKLDSCNWLADLPGDASQFDIVEVHFKNTRRGFYRNSSNLTLHQGDWVAVEANPGHDIGQVALTGPLVRMQMKRVNLRPDAEILRVFRKARAIDMERYEEAKSRETDTMIRSRKIAADLGLKMKIGDVEYQGDGNKAIFYYIADERVDFRQLIKVLADVFKIRVEMKQIGARQEAGRIGGIGPCGRPMCCASWMTNFVSVATSAARFQDISLNPQKLAGQCAKLKCCINFEVDTYVEASKKMPSRDVVLETKDKVYYLFKCDVLKREMTYSTQKNQAENTVVLTPDRVNEVMKLNSNGIKPDKLTLDDDERKLEQKAFGDILGQDSISRFDKKKKKKKKGNGAQQPAHETAGDRRRDNNNNPVVHGERRDQQPPRRRPQQGKNNHEFQRRNGNLGQDNKRERNQGPQSPRQ